MFQKLSVTSPQDIRLLAVKHGIDTANWLKVPEKLFTELCEEKVELGLSGSRLTMMVEFVRVEVYSPDQQWVLEEDYMVRHRDGKVGAKHFGRRSVSEKILRTESFYETASRGLHEELFWSFSPALLCHYALNYLGRFSLPDRNHYAYSGLTVSGDEILFRADLGLELYRPKYWEVQAEKTVYFNWFPVDVVLPNPKFNQ